MMLSLTLTTLCVFSSASASETEKVLYSFTGGNDGAQPFAGLTFDQMGNLYGTATTGGTQNCKVWGGTESGCGVVFKLSPVGGKWQFNVIHTFTGGADGGVPATGLVFDKSGNLYGTTSYGGDLQCSIAGSSGCGVVFELTPSAHTWMETTLYAFTLANGDGGLPTGGVSLDASGNIYGTTAWGGNSATSAGTVFRLRKTSEGWKEGIYALDQAVDGSDPQCATLGLNNNIFVDTYMDGAGGWGTVIELQFTSKGLKKTVLTSFSYGDGAAPTGCLTVDPKGNVYGTTQQSPTVFELSPSSGSQWLETILFGFDNYSDGNFPSAGVKFDRAGDLYGTCEGGGLYGDGTVFRLSPHNGNGERNADVLYTFTGKSDGSIPASSLVGDSLGNIYGTTYEGGILAADCNGGCGVVFQLTRN
jgi:uncharacterized repeat protein (TIGR03803 family)